MKNAWALFVAAVLSVTMVACGGGDNAALQQDQRDAAQVGAQQEPLEAPPAAVGTSGNDAGAPGAAAEQPEQGALPATASPLPLAAVLGGLALAASFAVRRYSRRG